MGADLVTAAARQPPPGVSHTFLRGPLIRLASLAGVLTMLGWAILTLLGVHGCPTPAHPSPCSAGPSPGTSPPSGPTSPSTGSPSPGGAYDHPATEGRGPVPRWSTGDLATGPPALRTDGQAESTRDTPRTGGSGARVNPLITCARHTVMQVNPTVPARLP